MHLFTRVGSIALAAGLSIGASAVVILPAEAHTGGIHDNCTELHKRWAHGVGRRDARDRTSGDPVTNFHKSNRQYRRANNHNGTLDADNDKIACEAH